MTNRPVVAIVGRPNVGKSTLFNRLIKQRKAIVEGTPNLTRDRIYGEAKWQDESYTVVDTGGLELSSTDEFKNQVEFQVEEAIREAHLIIFVVDVREGIMPLDEEIARMLRQKQANVIVAANKMDDFTSQEQPWEFYSLGFDEVIPISAEHGKNIGDLNEKIANNLANEMQEAFTEDREDVIEVAIVGKPNVGKSSLVNYLLGENRVIVSPKPGTTRDAVDTILESEGTRFNLIDTAGLRKKARVHEDVEYYSNLRAIKAIERANVVVMMLDAGEGVTKQDKKIVGYAHDEGKPVVLAVNKWDTIPKDTHTVDLYREEIYHQLKFINFAPITFISALTGKRVHEILELSEYVYDQSLQRIKTGVLNEVIQDAIQMNPPPSYQGKRLKIYYVTQTDVGPPHFVFFVNNPDLVHFAYKRFLENEIRKAFGFVGTPVRMKFKQRE